MSERVHVELTRDFGQYNYTYAAEARAYKDAVDALVATVEQMDEYEEEMEL